MVGSVTFILPPRPSSCRRSSMPGTSLLLAGSERRGEGVGQALELVLGVVELCRDTQQALWWRRPRDHGDLDGERLTQRPLQRIAARPRPADAVRSGRKRNGGERAEQVVGARRRDGESFA